MAAQGQKLNENNILSVTSITVTVNESNYAVKFIFIIH